jgi:hypothetical protein
MAYEANRMFLEALDTFELVLKWIIPLPKRRKSLKN